MIWKVQYSASSREDLQSIYRYIAYELFSPKAAEGQVERIMKAVRSLDRMALRHPIYHNEPWKSKKVRFFPVDNYVIFYLPNNDLGVVNIVRIIYGGRDMAEQINEDQN